jgi:hypothetical protein
MGAKRLMGSGESNSYGGEIDEQPFPRLAEVQQLFGKLELVLPAMTREELAVLELLVGDEIRSRQ